MEDIDGDHVMFRRMVSLFTETTPGLIAKLRQAVEARDLEAIGRTAHKLRGSALQFNAHAASELAGQIEQVARTGTLDEIGTLLPQLQVAFVHVEHELRQASQHD
jgi:histidine phosphotransfer protein HptB